MFAQFYLQPWYVTNIFVFEYIISTYNLFSNPETKSESIPNWRINHKYHENSTLRKYLPN